jgi:hypothetical protein
VLRIEIIKRYYTGPGVPSAGPRPLLTASLRVEGTTDWGWRARKPYARPGWPTKNAWTIDYSDVTGRPHAITISDVTDPQTPVLVDGELFKDAVVDYAIQNPQDK